MKMKGAFFKMTHYDNEYIFYLTMVLYEKYLKDKQILLDTFYDKIRIIYNDYLKHDVTNRSLLLSIEEYVEKEKDFILKSLNECIEK